MRKATAFISAMVIIGSMVMPTIAVGTSYTQKGMSKYESAALIVDSLHRGVNNTNIIYAGSSNSVTEFMSEIATQIDNLTGYIYKLKATYDPNQYPLKLTIETSRNDIEKDKTSTIEASAKLIAKRAQEKYKDTIRQLAYVNDTVVGLCEYDIESANDIDKASDLAWSAYGCLTTGKAVCAGYTNAMTLIIEKLGIPVIEVIGESPVGVKHTWNKVYVDNKWLNIDVTSNDPIWEGTPTDKEVKKSTRRYFLVTDDFMRSKGYRWSRTDVEISKDIKYPNIVDEEQQVVKSLKIMSGTDKGMEPEKELTRSELAVILVRLEGKSREVERCREHYYNKCLFGDVAEWAKPYVGYCIENGLLSGLGGGKYGGEQIVTKRDFSTILLRTLRIDKSAYDWNSSVKKTVDMGIVSPGRDMYIRNGIVYRSDVIDSIVKALDIQIDGNTSIRNRINSDR